MLQAGKRRAVLWLALVAFVGTTLTSVALAEGEASGPSPECGIEAWRTAGGTIALAPNESVLENLGLALVTLSQTDVAAPMPELASVFVALEGTGLEVVSYDGVFRAVYDGQLQSMGELALRSADGASLRFGDLRIERGDDSTRWVVSDTLHGNGRIFDLQSAGAVRLDTESGSFDWSGLEVFLSSDFAARLGVDDAADPIGVLYYSGAIESLPAHHAFKAETQPVADPSRGGIGPDVIVGDIYDQRKWGTVGSRSSYSFGTESCNIGDETLAWIANNNLHPVIGQSVFRVDPNEVPAIKQISQGWLKHGFCALSLSLCDPCQSGTGCEALGIGCSDPYSAFLNGDQSGLGPRSEVNATTGFFPYPPANPPYSGSLARRNIIDHADIQPAQNPNARYYVEAQYITQDDAQAGNGNNNASWRRIAFNASNNVSFIGGTVREQTALEAWSTYDPEATIQNVDAFDGRYVVGYKVTDNLNGTWTYEYAIYNQNSDASMRRFEVPFAAGVNITNAGFRDIDYHSGEPYSGTDWTFSTVNGMARWTTDLFAVDPDANALRWSTLYNFWFTADGPPVSTNATATHFKVLDTFNIAVEGPDAPTNPFLLTLDLDSTTTTVARGERFDADAMLTTQAAMPLTQVRFQYLGEEPGGDPYDNNPLIDRTKSIPGGIQKTRTVKVVIAPDAPLGEHTFTLTAERLSDGAMQQASITVMVTN